MAKAKKIREKIEPLTSITDEEQNQCEIVNLDFDDEKSQEIKNKIQELGLTSGNSLKGISMYFFLQSKIFYKTTGGLYVADYNGHREELYNYSAMVSFIKNIK